MKLPNKQYGMTGIGWLLSIALIILVMLIVIKLIPAYVDQFNVSSVLSSLKKEPGIANMGGKEVTNAIMKRLDINMVKDVTLDDIYISQEGRYRVIEIEYQVQRHLLGNVDVLLNFNNRIEIPIK